MTFETNSIIDIVESSLNKKIEDVKEEDLDNIKYLRVSKIGFDDILNVNIRELNHFKKLEDLSIDCCIIDNSFLDILKSLSTIKKLNFINCDFVDDSTEYFENLSLNELVLNDTIGVSEISFSNINKLAMVNIPVNCSVQNVNTLDISRSSAINIDLDKLDIKTLIINVKQFNDEYLNLPYTVIIKNDFDEIFKVIKHD